jgi:hypothetical protein
MAFFVSEPLPEAYEWLLEAWNAMVARIAELEAEVADWERAHAGMADRYVAASKRFEKAEA